MKSFRAAILFYAMYALIGCGSTTVQKDFYSRKHPKFAIEIDKDGRKDGKESWWYANGAKKYEAVNKHGLRNGHYTAWYPDGKPWYEGYEYRGKPESTLTFWHPNGRLKSKALFRDGIQLERKDFDEEGNPLVSRGLAGLNALPTLDESDDGIAADGLRLRKAGLQVWAQRVRKTVEGFWILPKNFAKDRPYRAVARIKVRRDGKIMGVTWSEKSPSAAFNTLAQQTFKRINRLPIFPPQIKDEVLEIQYEFISLGRPGPRLKLKARDAAVDPDSASLPDSSLPFPNP